MPQVPRRTLSIYDKGSSYTIIDIDTDDRTHLFTGRFNSNSTPQMTVIRASSTNSVVGSATYYAAKGFSLFTALSITLMLPSSGVVSLNEEGDFFGNDKRTMRSAAPGQVNWNIRQVNNPWKGGRLETSFGELTDTGGRTLGEYTDEGHTLKRMAVLEIGVRLTEKAWMRLSSVEWRCCLRE